MILTATPVPGAWVIDLEPIADQRGFFARSADTAIFLAHGLEGRFIQQSVSWNPRAGTLRGMHVQASPHAEDKLVRATRGAIFDVIVDARPGSASHGRWHAVELSADNRRQLYIPKGVLHGFQTLEPDTEVFYQMTVPFAPEAARGVRWDDPAIGIAWPDCPGRLISDRDAGLPPLAALR